MTYVINVQNSAVCCRFPDVLWHNTVLQAPDVLLPAPNHLGCRCAGLLFSSTDVPLTPFEIPDLSRTRMQSESWLMNTSGVSSALTLCPRDIKAFLSRSKQNAMAFCDLLRINKWALVGCLPPTPPSRAAVREAQLPFPALKRKGHISGDDSTGTEQKVQVGPRVHSFETQALLHQMLLANARDIGNAVGSVFHPKPSRSEWKFGENLCLLLHFQAK